MTELKGKMITLFFKDKFYASGLYIADCLLQAGATVSIISDKTKEDYKKELTQHAHGIIDISQEYNCNCNFSLFDIVSLIQWNTEVI